MPTSSLDRFGIGIFGRFFGLHGTHKAAGLLPASSTPAAAHCGGLPPALAALLCCALRCSALLCLCLRASTTCAALRGLWRPAAAFVCFGYAAALLCAPAPLCGLCRPPAPLCAAWRGVAAFVRLLRPLQACCRPLAAAVWLNT